MKVFPFPLFAKASPFHPSPSAVAPSFAKGFGGRSKAMADKRLRTAGAKATEDKTEDKTAGKACHVVRE